MTDEKRNLLESVHSEFFNIMLNDFAHERLNDIVIDDVMGYGTTIDEKIFDLAGLQKLAMLQKEQAKDLEIHISSNPVHRKITDDGNVAIYVDEVLISMVIADGKNEFNARVSTILEFQDGKWKIIHWHGSKPVESEGDTWHKEEWKQKNEALQKLVDEKTADLENKNYELEMEAALERVRAVAMSMHKPDDLLDVCCVISEQLVKLNVSNIRNVQLAIINKQNKTYSNYQFFTTYSKKVFEETGYENNPASLAMVKEMQKSANSFFIGSIKDEDLEKFTAWRKEHGQFPDPIIDDLTELFYYFYSIGEGGLGLTTYKAISDHELEIFKRFHQVFKLAYRRFLDIQQAEAQAKEARIEAALERIRSRALAMNKSTEVGDVSDLLFSELEKMDINPTGFSIMVFDREQDKYELWRAKEVAHQGVYETFSIRAMYDKLDKYIPGFTEELESKWNSGAPFFIAELSGQKRIAFLEANREMGNYTKDQFEKVVRIYPDPIYWHLMFFKHGWLGLIQNEQLPTDNLMVIHRFADVFEFAHTRFLDLQKVEAQAREVQIELSLERIRSHVTAMQESSELLDIVVIMRNEFVTLGHEAHYFWHMRWLPEKYEKAMTSGDGTRIGMVMTLPRHIHGEIQTVANWEKSDKPTFVLAMDAENAVDYVHKMITLGDFEIVDHNAPTLDDIRHIGGLTFVMARTTHGEIGYSLPGAVPNPPKAAVGELARFAGVFDLAYKRFEDLKTAEKDLIEIKAARQNAEEALLELKATQSQLIQSEKMASLGELTAGIAHEIQNPLNFVNNFAEVNVELIAELKEELEAGNLEEIKSIADDIAINEEKILQHGKRADSIVKGMLQHSRSSNGQKELTDINTLCDEYLRLSYHGLRAKDKSFNADFKTEFDASLPKINIIPQDIGRVLLNLINNAFYVVAERQKNLSGIEETYKPSVTITTKNLGESIEISVKDNGNGIPEEIKNKIFQPFFTTKPTGEGTGLGLSLSYDIVKAHGGELKVESLQGVGSEFIIRLKTL